MRPLNTALTQPGSTRRRRRLVTRRRHPSRPRRRHADAPGDDAAFTTPSLESARAYGSRLHDLMRELQQLS